MEQEAMDIGFEEFAAAFDDDGYQTDTTEDTAQDEATEETTEETGGEGQDADGGEESAGDGADGEPGEESAGDGGDRKPDDKPDDEQMFTIKVNKEDRQVGLAEMTALAQKGADYDRVKGQLETSRKAEQSLQEKLNARQEIMDTLDMISSQSNIPVDQLVEQVYMNFLKGGGKTEAEAKAEIRATKAERELNAMKGQQAKMQAESADSQTRAQKEVTEFRKDFPDVELTEELCNKLMSDVQSGMSLSNAYRKLESARKDAEIAELQRKLEAEKQNRKNRVSSPGSQSDSGGQRQKTDFDEFMAAFM